MLRLLDHHEDAHHPTLRQRRAVLHPAIGHRDAAQLGEFRPAHLLRGLAVRFPASGVPAAAVPAPVAVPEVFAAAPVPEQPAPAPQAPQVVMLDQNPDGLLLMAAPLPCVQCRQPSVYRAQGHPMHLGGFCRPVAAVQAATAPAAPAAAPAPPAAPVAPTPKPSSRKSAPPGSRG
ncbi:hypothetical protein ACWC9T_32470 [Kitasatospora sp. NPDC001159]